MIETARSVGERGNDHKLDIEKPIFEIKVVKFHKSALEKQVHEAVLVSKKKTESNYVVLNSKGIYNRCRLPRWIIANGDQPYNELAGTESNTGELSELEKVRNEKILRKAEKKSKMKNNLKWGEYDYSQVKQAEV